MLRLHVPHRLPMALGLEAAEMPFLQFWYLLNNQSDKTLYQLFGHFEKYAFETLYYKHWFDLFIYYGFERLKTARITAI